VFRDLDYLRDKSGLVWLVKGDHHPEASVYAYPVYWPDSTGERQHTLWGNYRKQVNDCDHQQLWYLRPETRPAPDNLWAQPLLPRHLITERFSPVEAIPDFIEQEPTGQWLDVFNALLELGVPSEQIGILGSRLVGLDQAHGQRIKDVDFCIYGIDNQLLVRQQIEDLCCRLQASEISSDHIDYHVEKFGRFFDPNVNDFKRGLQRKWASLQLAPGLLLTLRFGYDEQEIPDRPVVTVRQPLEESVRGRVVCDLHSCYMPRRFTVDSGQELLEVLCPYWGYHCCVRTGDHVWVTGERINEYQLAVRRLDHGIKIL